MAIYIVFTITVINPFTELENTEILQMVRGVAASPEELRELLDRIRTAKELPQMDSAKKEDFERENENG